MRIGQRARKDVDNCSADGRRHVLRHETQHHAGDAHSVPECLHLYRSIMRLSGRPRQSPFIQVADFPDKGNKTSFGILGSAHTRPMQTAPTACDSGFTSMLSKVVTKEKTMKANATTMDTIVRPNSGTPHGEHGDPAPAARFE